MYTIVDFSYHTTSFSDQMLVVGTITARSNSFFGFKKYCCNIFHGIQLFNVSPRCKKYPNAISLEKLEHLRLIENCFTYYTFFLNE